MKRIGIYLETSASEGGAFQYTWAVVEALSQINVQNEKYEVCAYSLSDDWERICFEKNLSFCRLRKNIVQKIILKIWRALPKNIFFQKIIWFFHPVWAEYRKKELSLIIFPNPSLVGAVSQGKSLVTIYDIMHRYLTKFPEVSEKKVYAERDKRYRLICRNADGIFADSAVGKMQICESYRKYVPDIEKKVLVLPYTIPDYLVNNRVECKCPGKIFEKYCFYPAQFWKHKNHKNLILALNLLRNKGKSVCFIFTGYEKNAGKEIKKMIQELSLEKQILILNYVSNEEMKYLYSHARAMIMPSYGGPTNIPPLEAMAMGCPVAVSDIYAMPEQIGDAGLLFNPDSVEEIAGCIERLWDDDELCEELKGKAFERSKKVSIEIFTRGLLTNINAYCL